MAFMTPQIERGDWWGIEGDNGTTFVPSDVVGAVPRDADGDATELAPFADYYDGGRVDGATFYANHWGARLSAPGYLDCTDWCIFQTHAQAREYIRETWECCPDTGDALPCSDGPEDDPDALRDHVTACPECLAMLDVCGCGECFTDPA